MRLSRYPPNVTCDYALLSSIAVDFLFPAREKKAVRRKIDLNLADAIKRKDIAVTLLEKSISH